jgi:single-stranded-DNA-specific exonuclease
MSAETLSASPAAAFGIARSLSGRRWRLLSADASAVQTLVNAAGVSEVLARLLLARGVTQDTATGYLNPTLKQSLPEPLTLKDMDRAVARAQAAIERGEKIAIFGDYDVDGSTSAALLSEFLSTVGAQPQIYIPDRMTEGYGPNEKALLQLHADGAALVITVDCGAGAVAPLTAARNAGLDIVILDHHAVDVAPPCVAHVNPNQPGDTSGLGHVCAAGITFLFVVALNRSLRESGWYRTKNIKEPDLFAFVDLVGLATVCDVVPLTGLNRAFVRAGLSRLARLDRPGMAALAAVAGIAPPFTSYHLGYIIGPRINAGGRVGRSSLGVDLLLATTDAAAADFARKLDIHNRERQAIEKLILDEAIALAGTQANSPFLFVASDGWHAGVVGIVAGRLKDRFGKPSFVAGFEGGLGRGSARSVAGIDIGANEFRATIVVTTNADSGAGSLRQAILNANAIPGADTITLDPVFFATAKTILLTGGELLIADAVTIAGPGATLAIIHGNDAHGVFNLNGPGTIDVFLSGLTITHGKTTGGAFGAGILNQAENLTLTNSVVSNNVADGAGGGVSTYGGGTLVVDHCTISGNQSNFNGGGLDGNGRRVLRYADLRALTAVLEQLGPRTLQSLALIAEVVHGTPTRFDDPARFSFAHGGKDGHPFPVPLKVYDESISVLRRALDSAQLGHSDKLHGFSRLDAFARAIEQRRAPDADVAATIARERAMSPSLGGRTVFDDRGRRTQTGRPRHGQLGLFSEDA